MTASSNGSKNAVFSANSSASQTSSCFKRNKNERGRASQLRALSMGVFLLVLLFCLSPHATSQSCSTSCTGFCLQQTNPATSVSGTVYAPNGTTPLPNVLVYVPNGGPAPAYGVTAFPPGVSCGVSASGCPLVSAVSATNGTFTLTNVPVGTNIPLVIQAGKWRRKISIPDVPAGINTALTAAQTSLPTTEAEFDPADNIPYIAVVTGEVDAAECVLSKMGVASSEFTNPPGSPAPNNGRINFYLGAANGGSGAGQEINASTPSEAALFASQLSVNAYDLLMFPCQGSATDVVAENATNQGYLGNYANAGGHIYATHYSYQWLYTNTAFAGTVNWDTAQTSPTPDPQTGYVNTSYPQGAQLAQWLKDVGASTTLGQIPLNTLRKDQNGVLGSTLSVLTIDYPSASNPTVMQLTFNTPLTAAPANQCGQVLFNEYHVFEESNDSHEVFPAACTAGALTAQEQLLAYSVFSLSTVVSAQPAPTVTVVITNSPATFVVGDSADTITINVTNTSTTSPTNPTLTLTVAPLPAGMAATNMVGSTPTSGWNCNIGTLTCTRTTGLSASTSDAVTLTVSLASKPPGSTEFVSATASGGLIASNVTGNDNIPVLGETAIAVTGVAPSNEDWGNDAPATITAQETWQGSGAPSGAVTISGMGLSGSFSATTCGGAMGITITCQAQYTPSAADMPGTYTFTATAAADSNFAGSSSTQSNNFTINLASTTTSITSGANPSFFGQPVTFTATIDGEFGMVKGRNGAVQGGAGSNKKGALVKGALAKNGSIKGEPPNGGAANKPGPRDIGGGTASVTWSPNTGCGPTLVTSGYPGTATCTTSSLGIGDDAITATYSGDGDHSGSTGTLVGGQQVNANTTSIAVTNVNPSNEDYGLDAPVAITAVLSWTGTGPAPTSSDVTIGGVGLSGSFGTTSCGAPSGTTMTCTNSYTPTPSDGPSTYQLIATFTGDSNYSGSDGAGLFTINAATSTTSVSCSPNPSSYGQSTTCTATIGGENGDVKGRAKGKPRLVSGTVTWSANTGCGTTNVTAGYPGTASCTTSILPVGTSNTVTATYSGDSNHSGSTGSATQNVSKAMTSMSVTVNPTQETYGQTQFISIVGVLSWPGNGTAPSTSASNAVTINAAGFTGAFVEPVCGPPSNNTITCTGGYTPQGEGAMATSINVLYKGDANYSGSTGGTPYTILPATSTTTVSCSPNPSVYGQSATCTATMGGENGDVKGRVKGKPRLVSGTVLWSGNTGCGTTNVTAGYPGTATCTTSSLAVGSDLITANYSGDGNHSGSAGSTNQAVNRAATSLSVTSVTPNNEDYGLDAPVTIKAVLSWAGSGAAPTTSAVTIGGNGNGSYGATSCAPVGSLITCQATYTPTPADTPGSYTETATFAGDGNYNSSISGGSNNFTINAATSSTVVTSSNNPSGFGQPVTFTATINGENGNVTRRLKGKPRIVNGTVTWSANTGCGTTNVTAGNPGIATCTTSSLPLGTDGITAQYSGDSDHGPSSGTLSGGEVINQQSQTITFTINAPGSAIYNTSFTVAATASSGLPVAFTAAGSCINAGPIYRMTSGAGTCSVIANQVGDGSYSAAPTVTETVTAAPASQTITFPAIPNQSGPGTVTLNATASSGLPVSYSVSPSNLGVVNGNIVTTMGAGTITVVASQAGNANYSAATPVSQSFTVGSNSGSLNGSNCNGAFTGIYKGNLTVSKGQICILENGGVTGNLTQTGGTVIMQYNAFVNGNYQMSAGSFTASNSTIGNDLQISGPGNSINLNSPGSPTFSIGPAVSVGGNLQIQSLAPGSTVNQVCGVSVHNDLQFQSSGAPVLIGSASGCAGNTVGGNLTVQSNTAATTVDSNTVGGNLTDQSNTAATQVFTNYITNNLTCQQNTTISGGGNTVVKGTKQGQCATF